MTRFNVDLCASKETTISGAFIPRFLWKIDTCHISHQLALSFRFTHGFGSKENFSQSSRNIGMFMDGINNTSLKYTRISALSMLYYHEFKIINTEIIRWMSNHRFRI